jgi:hypothetical protein
MDKPLRMEFVGLQFGSGSGFMNIMVSTGVSLFWGDIAYSRVTMLGVVPGHEIGEPGPSFGQGAESFWVTDIVLKGLEKRLNEWVIVTDPWSGVTQAYVHPGEEANQGNTLHRSPIICVDKTRLYTVVADYAPEQGLGVFGAFLQLDGPAHYLSRVDIDYDVGIVK